MGQRREMGGERQPRHRLRTGDNLVSACLHCPRCGNRWQPVDLTVHSAVDRLGMSLAAAIKLFACGQYFSVGGE